MKNPDNSPEDERAPDSPETGLTQGIPTAKRLEMNIYRATSRLITLKEQCRKAGFSYATLNLVLAIEKLSQAAAYLAEQGVNRE